MSRPLRKCKAPYCKLSGYGSDLKPHILSLNGFVAFGSLLSAKVTNMRIVTLQLQPFGCVLFHPKPIFSCVCELFTAKPVP